MTSIIICADIILFLLGEGIKLQSLKKVWVSLAIALGIILASFGSIRCINAEAVNEANVFAGDDYRDPKNVDSWPQLSKQNFAHNINDLQLNRLSKTDNDLTIAAPNDYWNPDRYSNLDNLQVVNGNHFSGNVGKALKIVDNSQPASVTIPHYLHHQNRWINLIYTFQLAGDNNAHNWTSSRNGAVVCLNLGSKSDPGNWFSLWTNSASPRNYYGTTSASRWQVQMKFVYADNQEPVDLNGNCQFMNVNTQKSFTFPQEQLGVQKNTILVPDATSDLRGILDAGNASFSIQGPSNYTDSGIKPDLKQSFIYLFKQGQLNFTNIRSGSNVWPNAMFNRLTNLQSIAKELPDPDLGGTINNNGQLRNLVVDKDSVEKSTDPNIVQYQLFQQFPKQSQTTAPQFYQVLITVPKYVQLPSIKNIELTNYGANTVSAAVAKNWHLGTAQDNNDGTHTYRLTFDGRKDKITLNDLNLQLKINAQINFDSKECWNQLQSAIKINDQKQSYIDIPATFKTENDTTAEPINLGKITSQVQVPQGTWKIHYVTKQGKELQKPDIKKGLVNTNLQVQPDSMIISAENDECHYVYAQDATGQEINPEQLQYKYAENQPQDLYLVYRVGNKHESVLKGKKIAFLGSSVTKGMGSKNGNTSFVEDLTDQDGIIATKEAVNGTTLAGQGADTYVNRMKNKYDPQKHFDLFVCQLSTNDAVQNKPLGKMTALNDFKITDYDLNTTTGAIEYICKYVQDTWHCPVIFYAGTIRGGDKQIRYESMINRLQDLQKKWHFTIIDIYHNHEVNALFDSNPRNYLASYSISDYIHPNDAGYQVWTPIFRNEFINILMKN